MRVSLRALGVGLISALSLTLLPPAHALLLVGPTNDLSGSGSISAPGATESWFFDANPAGGVVTIVGSPTSSLQLTELLIDPNGNSIATATGGGLGLVVTLSNVPILMTGIYTLTIGGFNGTTGDYQLQVTGSQDPFNGSQASIHSLASAPEPASLILVLSALTLLAWTQSKRCQREQQVT